ncbi:hypothetical protein CXF85_11880 [Colwellia sp. 75C3]|uniref:hypothetical protein n=1 Tax=Colwellia sp. 75C3 TaxID=888425 RepID=UPI000C3483D2|nr:hypothetical protein [Colwellia sp. 75C3]PKG83039.1 hypothetical protein CXF85_11880 [Colwellia sp. 75C3]
MKTVLMNIRLKISLVILAVVFVDTKALANDEQATAEPVDRVELKTSFIKGNKELPQVLYIVPWQEIKKTTKKPKNMVLHSLYGDIFQPITPADISE